MWVRHYGDGRSGSCAGACSFLNAPARNRYNKLASIEPQLTVAITRLS
jgi:hypothetical protein